MMKLKSLRYAVLLLALSLLLPASAIHAAPKNAPAKKILFIGNSYTAGIRSKVRQQLGDKTNPPPTLFFIAPGGMTLQGHLNNPQVLKQIRDGKWDYVVLQEQSQLPGFPEGQGTAFETSVGALSKIIRDAGAEPLLFLTWGRRDGDQMNREVYPDYKTMQARLAQGYVKAGQKHKVTVIPVGLVWAEVIQQNPKLGKTLYSQDGSHPSNLGAQLSAAVFTYHFSGKMPAANKPPKHVNRQEWGAIVNALRKVASQK